MLRGMSARSWDAPRYDEVSTPMVAMGREVLARLPLRGDERVLDAGCGTGLVTALLLERLPDGHVVAVDQSAAMLDVARRALPADRVTLVQADLAALALDAAVDAVLSTATFHWVLDHDALFARLAAVLRPGGRLVAQCGGAGNIAGQLATAAEVGADEPFAPYFDGWARPVRFATAEETAARLAASGFVDVDCRLTPRPVVPEDPRAYLETVTLGAHLDQLPDALRSAFVGAVLARHERPVTVDYVRLDIDARRAG